MEQDRPSCIRHKLCIGCGYIIDGLPWERCPECGRSFNPGDPSTFRLEGQVDPDRYGGVPILALALLGAGLLVEYWDHAKLMSLLAVEIEGLALGLGLVRIIRRTGLPDTLTTAAMAFALLALFSVLAVPQLQ